MTSERRHAYAMVAPAVVLLASVSLLPVLAAVWLSLQRWILVFGERRFAGLENYRYLLSDDRFLSAFGHTASFTLVAVTIELALAIPIALVLDAPLRGRSLLRALVLLPWAIPTAVAAKLWAWLFAPELGPLSGFVPDMLASPTLAMGAAILVDVWKTTPFVAFLVLAGLQSIPQDVYRAAAVDGASPARAFFSITLPLLRPSIALAVMFRALDAFRVFDVIYVLTEGGPANTTETLSIYAYKLLMRSGDFGYGSTVAVVTFALVIALALILLRLGKGARA